MIFQYLDRNHQGYITYGDFCELSDERRRNIDNGPADNGMT